MEPELCSGDHSLRPIHVFEIQGPQSCPACYRFFLVKHHVPFSSAIIWDCCLFGYSPSDSAASISRHHHHRLILSFSVLSEVPKEHRLPLWSSLRHSHGLVSLVALSFCRFHSQEQIMDDALESALILSAMADVIGFIGSRDNFVLMSYTRINCL